MVGAALLAAPAVGAPTTTLQRTIVDREADDPSSRDYNLLEYGPGEDYSVFPQTAGEDFRPPRQGSILNFLQLSDFQIVDEESPGRVEFLDTTQRVPGLNPFSAAYRPQESLTTQITEAMVRQARNTTSPITGERLDLSILTGDNADSQQFNETRWFIDILDGTTGPGNPDPEMEAEERPGADRKIVPDSGLQSELSTCDPPVEFQDRGSLYDGVRGGGRPGPDPGYYEPDGSAGGKDDGDGYSPSRTRNLTDVPGIPGTSFGDVTVRDFPNLLEDAQEPFEAVGLGMPWYSAFGNHDALVQGNGSQAYAGPNGPGPFPAPPAEEKVDPVYDKLVRGCVKVRELPSDADREDVVEDPGAFLSDPSFVAQASPFVVPPDPRRCHLAKDLHNDAKAPCLTGGWIQQHSRTLGTPAGHGFEPFGVEGQSGAGRPDFAKSNHDGYYSFNPREGLRFIVIDTVTDECGPEICAEGSVDDTQFKWIEDEIEEAAGEGEYVLVFSHHTLRTTRQESTDPTERAPATPEFPLGYMHFGERFDRKRPAAVRPDAPPESTLEDLFCRHPNFLAHVNGHEHENYVLQHRCEDAPAQQSGKTPFWEISTAAHIDFPQQARMIELVDNGDRTMSLILTILDHDGPAYPGGPRPGELEEDAHGHSGDQVLRLASIGREIAYNDYQGSRGARGGPPDRNVIVKLAKPFPFEP